MTEAGKRLLAAAHEALAFAKGEADPKSYIVHAPPPTVDVKKIRAKMGMTQAEFGDRFGFGKARVRDWEQRRTRPAASDRVLLVTIDTDPELVLRALELHGAKPTYSIPLAGSAEPSSDTQAHRKVIASGTSRREAAKPRAAKPSARAAQKAAAG